MGNKLTNLFQKLRSQYEVWASILNIKIAEFGFFRKPMSIARFGIRIAKGIVETFRCLQSRFKKTDQVVRSSDTKKANQKFVRVESVKEAPKEISAKGDKVVSKLPIVFIHFSNSDYLQYSLNQAKESNPDSTIYLLGDYSNDCYDVVEHHLFSDYYQGANEFSKIYRHFSTLSRRFECFCFQRWFILRDFLVANKLDKCLYLDSDTLLYADVTLEQKKFEEFDFTLSQMTSGCTFFLNSVEALDAFCDFVINIYTKKDRYHYDKMVSHFAVRKKNNLPGGVCDMTAFGLYREGHFGEIGEVAQIIDGSVYDPAISIPTPGFEMINGIKKITWKNGKPYGKHLKTKKEIRFNSLQFHGGTTSLMGQYYKQL